MYSGLIVWIKTKVETQLRSKRPAFGVCRITAVLTLVFRVHRFDGVRDSLDASGASPVTKIARAVNMP